MPNIVGHTVFGMSGEYIGKTTRGVLPNITGQLLGLKSINGNYTSGAIRWTTASREGVYGSGAGSYGTFYFNANQSSSIYGAGWYDGDRVVPASVGMLYVIKY